MVDKKKTVVIDSKLKTEGVDRAIAEYEKLDKIVKSLKGDVAELGQNLKKINNVMKAAAFPKLEGIEQFGQLLKMQQTAGQLKGQSEYIKFFDTQQKLATLQLDTMKKAASYDKTNKESVQNAIAATKVRIGAERALIATLEEKRKANTTLSSSEAMLLRHARERVISREQELKVIRDTLTALQAQEKLSQQQARIQAGRLPNSGNLQFRAYQENRSRSDIGFAEVGSRISVFERARLQARTADADILSMLPTLRGGNLPSIQYGQADQVKALRAAHSQVLAELKEQLKVEGGLNQETQKRITLMRQLGEQITANTSRERVLQAKRTHSVAMEDPAVQAELFKTQARLMLNYAVMNQVTTGLHNAWTETVKLESGLRNLEAITGATDFEMTKLAESLMLVGSNSKFSMVELSTAATVLGQAGLSVKEVGEALEAVSIFASAAGTDLGKAVDIVTSVVGVFNYTASDTIQIADKLSAAMNNSKLDAEKMALGLQYAGNTASQLGLTFEETTAALASMANSGIKSGSTLGTGLTQLLVELTDPSEKFRQQLAFVGLTLDDVNLKTSSLISVIRTLKESGFGETAAIKAFDLRAARAFTALNPEDLNKQYLGLHEQGRAMRANEVQMASLEAQGKRMGSTFNAMVSSGLEPLTKALTALASTMADLFSVMQKGGPILQALVTGMAAFAATAVGVGLFKMAMEFRTVMALASGFSAVLDVMKFHWAKMTAAAAGATTATGGFTAALGYLGKVVMAHPVGLFVTAVAAAAVAVYSLSSDTEELNEQMDELRGKVNEANGEFQSHQQTIGQLDKKMGELLAKQKFLIENESELKNQMAEVNSVIGKFGHIVDENLGSAAERFQNLVAEIKKTRIELQDLAGVSQSKALYQMQAFAEKAAETAKTQESKLSTGAFNVGVSSLAHRMFGGDLSKPSMNRFTAAELRNAGLTPAQLAVGQRGAAMTPDQLAKAGPDFLSRLSTVFVQVAEAAKKTGRLGGMASEALEAAEILNDIADAQNVNRQAQRELAESKKSQRIRVSSEALLAKKSVTGGGSIEDVLTQAAAQARTLRTVEGMNEVSAITKAINTQVAESGFDKEVIASVQARISAIEGAAASQYQNTAALTAGTRGKVAKINLQQYRAQIGTQVSALKGGLDQETFTKRIDALFYQILQEQIKVNTQGLEGAAKEDVRIATTSAVNAEKERVLANATNRVRTAARTAAVGAAEDEIKTAEEAIKALKKKASKSESTGDVFGFYEQAITQLRNIRDSEIAKGKTSFKNAQARFISELEQLSIDFAGYLNSGAGALSDIDRRIKAQAAGREAAKQQSSIDLYGKGAPLRAIEDKLAIASGSVSGSAFSETERYNLQVEKQAAEANYLAEERKALLNDQAQIEQAITLEQERQTALITNRAAVDAQIHHYTKLMHEGKIAEKEAMISIEALNDSQKNTTVDIVDSEGRVLSLKREQVDAAEQLRKITVEIQTLQPGGKDNSFGAGWDEAVKRRRHELRDVGKWGDEVYNVFNRTEDGFAEFVTNISTGSMSASDAIRKMVTDILKYMMQLAAQKFAANLIMSFMGSSGGMSAQGSAAMSSTATGSGSGLWSSGTYTGAATGGLIIPGGVKRFARGGPVTGGTPNRDSVPALLMPGEFVLNKEAAKAVGTDYLFAMNRRSADVVNSNGVQPSPKQDQSKGAGVVNVWVVSKDQQPPIGPTDVIAVVTDDISRGGSVKKMIKQVVMGG